MFIHLESAERSLADMESFGPKISGKPASLSDA